MGIVVDVPRTRPERFSDAAVLLALWERCSPHPREDAGDRLRQMKLAFLTAQRLREQRLSALHLTFYRWTWGPMSNEVYDAWELTKRAALLDEEEALFFTASGQALAREFYDDVLRAEENVRVREVIDAVVAEWRERPGTNTLLQHVYEMRVAPADGSGPRAIREIGKGVDLVEPLVRDETKGALHVPDAWMETLALTFSPADVQSLASSEDDFRTGRIHVA